MTSNTDQIKKTIRDLFNLAENDAATEGEISNAITFARRLMDRHHLSEEECRKDDNLARARVLEMDEKYFSIDGTRLAIWEERLAAFVMDFVGSVAAYYSNPQQLHVNGIPQFKNFGDRVMVRKVVFYGVAEDAAMAAELYGTLRDTIATMAHMKFRGTHRGPGRSYAEGFVRGLSTKLAQARQADAQISTESRALIVRSTELAKAAQERAIAWRQEKTGEKIRKASRRSVGHDGNEAAYVGGYQDGQRAEVSAQRRSKLTGETQKRLA